MRVSWVEVDDLDWRDVGHGLLFHTHGPGEEPVFIAAVRGFGWYHGQTDEATVEIRPLSDSHSPNEIAAVRADIEALICDPALLTTVRGWVTPRLYVHGNV